MVQPLYKAKRPLFSCEIMMSVVAQIRKSLTEHTEPASPPKSGHDADIAVESELGHDRTSSCGVGRVT
jgi:hypothetical protein